jgi:hypothetical protein
LSGNKTLSENVKSDVLPSAALLFGESTLQLIHERTKNLAKIFIETVRKKKCHIVAETHSLDLLGQFQSEIREGNIDSSDFIAY